MKKNVLLYQWKLAHCFTFCMSFIMQIFLNVEICILICGKSF